MRVEAPWTTVRRLLSNDVAVQNVTKDIAERERAELEVEVLATRINDRIIAFQERRQRRVNE